MKISLKVGSIIRSTKKKAENIFRLYYQKKVNMSGCYQGSASCNDYGYYKEGKDNNSIHPNKDKKVLKSLERYGHNSSVIIPYSLGNIVRKRIQEIDRNEAYQS